LAVDEVQDGIDRGHFEEAECRHAFELGEIAERVLTALLQSLRPFVSPQSPIHGADRRLRPLRPRPTAGAAVVAEEGGTMP
jgi:hypothetical protein